jgi:hypothetical protein
MEQAALKVPLSKLANFKKKCYDYQDTFIPFMFDILSFRSEVVDIFKRFSRIMYNNIVSFKSLEIVFKRIDYAI